jgi:hypothetical protein
LTRPKIAFLSGIVTKTNRTIPHVTLDFQQAFTESADPDLVQMRCIQPIQAAATL